VWLDFYGGKIWQFICQQGADKAGSIPVASTKFFHDLMILFYSRASIVRLVLSSIAFHTFLGRDNPGLFYIKLTK
jgi:hypothetical protein